MPLAPRLSRRPSLLLACWLFLACALGLGAAAPEPAPVPADIQRILARGALVVAMPAFDVPPFFYTRDGVLCGLDVDLASGLAKVLHVQARFDRRATSFDGVVDQVARGEADLAVCKLSRTLARAARVRFSEPYLTLHHALAINRLRFAELARGQDLAPVVRHYTGTLGVIRKSSFADFAELNFPAAKLIQFADWNGAVAALERGEVTALYRDEFEINCLLQSDPRKSLTLRSITLTDTEDSLGVAVPPGSQQLLALVNMYLAQRSGKLTIEGVLKRFAEIRR